MARYMAEPEIDIGMDTLLWWKQHEVSYPLLSQCAKRFLGIPATSVPCERIFSSAGSIISQKRASLLPKTAEVLVLLHADWKC